MTPTIRAGQPNDVEDVLRLWTRGGAEPTRTDDAQSLLALLDHPESRLLLAEEANRLVGSVIAGWDGWRGSVYRLVVDPSHRRQGLGGRLLDAAETHLQAVGAGRMQAVVVATEAAATGFWRTTHWEQQRDRLRFVAG